jgi:suppressor for copper-sensitivity B
MQIKKLIFSLIFLASFGNNFAFASNSEWAKAYEDSAQVRLIGSFYEKDGTKKLIAGLHFKISKGWKIYGADSGSFGLPPQIDLKDSINYKSHEITWPAAKSAEEKIGDEVIKYSYYHDEVILPIAIEIQNPTKETELLLDLNYGICKDICIPASAKLVLKIDNEIDEKALAEIQKFYPQEVIYQGTLETTEDSKPNHLKMFLYIVIFALLGGAILNIMPCVLPVLSIKLMSIVDHSEAPPARIRFAFLSTTIGILSSFLFFAVITVALKSAGHSLGWGLQFQNPYFLIFLIVILTLFAANLLGLFEVSFQQFVANFLNKKISQKEGEKNIFISNFLSGILAVLLATPCSAPFLGSAISFALVNDAITIFVIFIAIGVGFASPYIALMFSQKLIRIMPKPGMWMLKVKQLMALFLIATVIWLLYVLSHNIGDLAALIIALISVALFLALKIKSHCFKALVIGLLLIAAFAIPSDFKADEKNNDEKLVAEKYNAIWKNFSEEALEQYVAEGNVVVVDITADWCITCKFNKLRVFHDPEIMNLLKGGRIIGLRADITKPHEKIMDFMHRKNRFAIPFNAVYGPDAKEGLLTGELLSKQELLDLIKQAKREE